MMGLEKKLRKAEEHVRRFNNSSPKSLLGKVAKTAYLGAVVNSGGSLLSKYQNKIAQSLGWKAKNLTTANASIFGLGTAMFHFTWMYFFGDAAGDSAQNVLYKYPEFGVLQSFFRIGYSQIRGKAIGSVSLWNIFGSPVYAIGDFVRNGIKKR